jgi:hypothetical protein
VGQACSCVPVAHMLYCGQYAYLSIHHELVVQNSPEASLLLSATAKATREAPAPAGEAAVLLRFRWPLWPRM